MVWKAVQDKDQLSYIVKRFDEDGQLLRQGLDDSCFERVDKTATRRKREVGECG